MILSFPLVLRVGSKPLVREIVFMKIRRVNACPAVVFLVVVLLPVATVAADKLIGIQSARTMSQSMPWIADDVGLFKKYDLDFQLVFISSAAMVTAAMLSGD